VQFPERLGTEVNADVAVAGLGGSERQVRPETCPDLYNAHDYGKKGMSRFGTLHYQACQGGEDSRCDKESMSEQAGQC
jgi:hypothetical protein